jgi:hypothetical protein
MKVLGGHVDEGSRNDSDLINLPTLVRNDLSKYKHRPHVTFILLSKNGRQGNFSPSPAVLHHSSLNLRQQDSKLFREPITEFTKICQYNFCNFLNKQSLEKSVCICIIFIEKLVDLPE